LTSGYWSINPANNLLAPWLSNLAPNFEQFMINRLSIEYVPECNYIATGTITMAFLYDAADTNVPNTLMTLSQYEGAVTCAVRVPCVARIDLRRCQFRRYQILSDSNYVVDRLSVPAYFAYALSGATPGTPLGQLRFNYDFALCNCQYPERPLALHSAVLSLTPWQWPATDNVEVPITAVTALLPNVPNWVTWSQATGVVLNDVDEVNMSVIGRSTADPYTVSATAYGATNPLVVLKPDLTPFTTVNDHYLCFGSKSGTYSVFQLFMDIRRPTGTTGPWGFRLYCNGATVATYATGSIMDQFSIHISQARN
jgi:hypothetical protein